LTNEELLAIARKAKLDVHNDKLTKMQLEYLAWKGLIGAGATAKQLIKEHNLCQQK
jgi:hypothetical protein